MLICVQFFTGINTLLEPLFCVHFVQRAACIISFSHTVGIFSAESHGPVILRFRLKHFSTRSQLICETLCTYMCILFIEMKLWFISYITYLNTA